MDSAISTKSAEHDTAMIAKRTISTRLRRMFDGSLHAWEDWMLVALAAAAISAVAVVLTTQRVIKLTRMELEASRATTEDLRAKNLALESAISPRILEQGINGEKLKDFSDIPFRVISPMDFEPKRMAGQIRYMLVSVSGWKRHSGLVERPVEYWDGVVVRSEVGANAGRFIAAADALVEVLNSAGIDARRGPPVKRGFGAILVEVGPKPLPRPTKTDVFVSGNMMPDWD